MKAFDVARFHSTIVSQIYLGTLVSQSLVHVQSTMIFQQF